MSQALAQEHKPFSLTMAAPKQARPAALPDQASNTTVPSQATSDQIMHPSRVSQPSESSQKEGQLSESCVTATEQQNSPAHPSSLPIQAVDAAPYGLPNQAASTSLPHQATSPLKRNLPSNATLSSQQSLPRQARLGSAPQQATARHLPKQASSPKGSFLRVCLGELLRLSDPYSSQYQPLLCGWYDAAGEQIVGLE